MVSVEYGEENLKEIILNLLREEYIKYLTRAEWGLYCDGR